MLNKRGIGEEFNWIFVIVAGAIILAFFVMFAFKYINLQQERENIRNVKDFGMILDTLEKLPVGDKWAAIDSNKPGMGLQFGIKLNMEYQCLEEQANLIIGQSRTANYELKDQIVFIRNKQTIKALDMGLLPWRYPFHVTNLIYLSDPERKYYLVYDTSTKEYVESLEFPSAFSIEKVSSNGLKTEEKSTYIIFSKQKPEINYVNKLIGEKLSINFVYVNKKDDENGKVSFYEEGKWSEDVDYYGKELMYGAIFSNDYGNYKCTATKALNKLKTTAGIYLNKAEMLSRIGKQECRYQDVGDLLNKFAKGDYKLKQKLEEQNKAGMGCLEVF